jgi:putative restriction endonuclease
MIDELSSLSPAHRVALSWFADREDQQIAWPEPLEGLYLLNKAKGIHKPAGWTHALSVRQSLGSPYADKPVVSLSDGSWTYDYFQEGNDPNNRDDDFTNRALMQNMKDNVPVAVVRQVKAKPSPRYLVMGLAYVESWDSGYFRLRSVGNGAMALNSQEPGPISLIDARRRIDRQIVARQGAGSFRAAALAAFNGRCAITGYNVVEGLEAAHIVPYLGPLTNEVTNSLLLRADLHILFDRDLLTIDPATMCVTLDASLKDSSVSELDGVSARMPLHAAKWRPSLEQRTKLLHKV